MSRFTVTALRRLDVSPYEPSEDRQYWEADVMTDDDGPLTVRVYVTGSALVQLPSPPEDWVEAEVEKLADLYELDDIYAMSPIALRAPLD